jgi:hypothetical protein
MSKFGLFLISWCGRTEGFAEISPRSHNLACYETQLGNLKSAWQWLKRAFDIEDPKELKLRALEDPDLQGLWAEIGEI